jgi:hypothetical protein
MKRDINLLFSELLFFEFFIQTPYFFSFQYIIERLNKISFKFDLVFIIILQIYFMCDSSNC